MSDLASALIASLDDAALDALAELLAPRLAERLANGREDREDGDRWLTTAEAAEYIGRSVTALHKLTAARAIPFEQECPRGRCYFKRADLDAWMRARSASTPLPLPTKPSHLQALARDRLPPE